VVSARLMECQRHDFTRGEDYRPTTSRGNTRFDMQKRGPLRPGKTERDHRSGAWAQRQTNRFNRAEQNRRGR
jgi:hypothetical protein